MQFCDVWSCKIAELAGAILQRHQTGLHYCNFATSRPGLLLRASTRQRRFSHNPFCPSQLDLLQLLQLTGWLCANPCRFNNGALNRAQILFSSKQRRVENWYKNNTYHAFTKLYTKCKKKNYIICIISNIFPSH